MHEVIKSITIKKLFKGLKMMRDMGVRNFLRRVYGMFYSTQKGCIYPISLSEFEIRPDLNFLLLELPPRYVPMMPNGIGYVHNILKNVESVFRCWMPISSVITGSTLIESSIK